MKLAGQFAAAAIPVASGVWVENMTLPFVDPLDLDDWGKALTLVGMVAVMNVVNFTDGADGLAAGVCTIAAGTFAIIALSLDRPYAGILAALTAGAARRLPLAQLPPGLDLHGRRRVEPARAAARLRGDRGRAEDGRRRRPVLPAPDPRRAGARRDLRVAKRIKYRRPVYSADRWHFHHRFANIGFSQRRTVLYLYGWTLSLAALALAMRFVPYSEDDGTLNAGWALVIAAFGLVALAASLYLVLVLEILKFRRFREREIQRQVETGEMPALTRRADRARDRARGGDRRVRGGSARLSPGRGSAWPNPLTRSRSS